MYISLNPLCIHKLIRYTLLSEFGLINRHDITRKWRGNYFNVEYCLSGGRGVVWTPLNVSSNIGIKDRTCLYLMLNWSYEYCNNDAWCNNSVEAWWSIFKKENYNTRATSIGHSSSGSVWEQSKEFISLKEMSFSAIIQLISNHFEHSFDKSWSTAPLTSKSCILYIYSTNIGAEYFKHVISSLFFLFKIHFVS